MNVHCYHFTLFCNNCLNKLLSYSLFLWNCNVIQVNALTRENLFLNLKATYTSKLWEYIHTFRLKTSRATHAHATEFLIRLKSEYRNSFENLNPKSNAWKSSAWKPSAVRGSTFNSNSYLILLRNLLTTVGIKMVNPLKNVKIFF